jgi:cell division protein FtsA
MNLDKLKEIITNITNRKAPKTRHVVALDIGTDFVKTLVAKVGGGEAEIIGVAKVKQDLTAMQSGAVADISSVVEACDQALTEVEQQSGVDVREAIIGIAGELVKGKTTTVKYTRSKSQAAMSIEEIEDIVAKVQAKAFEQAKKRLTLESGNKNLEVRMVNSALVSIEVDGYPVSNPVGFQGKNVAVQLYTAFAPMIHIGALERIAEELDLELIALAAEPFAVARSVVGTDVSSNFSAILIDVGGGTTDIAVVHEGGVEGTQMFGIGGRAFTRSIANDVDIDFREAEELKLKFNEEKMPSAKSKLMLSAVDKTLNVWLGGVELALKEFKRLEHLPHRIYLCGGGASLNQVIGSLTERNWYKDLPFTKKPRIQYIAPSQIVGVVDKTSKIEDHTYTTAMGLIRVGLDSITDTTEESTWRERINRLLAT